MKFVVGPGAVTARAERAGAAQGGEPALARRRVAAILVYQTRERLVINDETDVARSAARRVTRFSCSRGGLGMMLRFSRTKNS